MATTMGFDFGLESPLCCFKRKYRWLLKIPEISATGVETLPPTRAARPSLTFKTLEAQHMHETIYFPAKPDWKPITLTLFDIKKNVNPVIKWIKELYSVDNKDVIYKYATNGFKKDAEIEMYDGCGEIIEKWVLENVFIESAEFGELDHSDSAILYIDLSLRYDRAWIEESPPESPPQPPQTIPALSPQATQEAIA